MSDKIYYVKLDVMRLFLKAVNTIFNYWVIRLTPVAPIYSIVGAWRIIRRPYLNLRKDFQKKMNVNSIFIK